jgi:hypothetical protein
MRRKKIQINKIRDEKEDVKTSTSEIQGSLRLTLKTYTQRN